MLAPSHSPLPAFGRRLRAMRRALGVKQLSLAHDLGVDQTSISRWESGAQTPPPDIQHKALALLTHVRRDDFTLRRLVEQSRDCLHLIDDTTHVCLAYSKRRAISWNRSQREMLGVALWQYATDEIQQAESSLDTTGWWGTQAPDPMQFHTSRKTFEQITVAEGRILWERLYLSDGTPVRLTTCM